GPASPTTSRCWNSVARSNCPRGWSRTGSRSPLRCPSWACPRRTTPVDDGELALLVTNRAGPLPSDHPRGAGFGCRAPLRCGTDQRACHTAVTTNPLDTSQRPVNPVARAFALCTRAVKLPAGSNSTLASEKSSHSRVSGYHALETASLQLNRTRGQCGAAPRAANPRC